MLISGGHNAGIISEPKHPHRYYRMATHAEVGSYLSPDDWYNEQQQQQQGSWWPAWQRWLTDHSSSQQPPPSMGIENSAYAIRCDAPGE